jgi:hypothetical protein
LSSVFPNFKIVKLEEYNSKLIHCKIKCREFCKALLPRSFGGVSFHGSCDLGSATINVISNTFYHEILEDIAPFVIRGTNITIHMED